MGSRKWLFVVMLLLGACAALFGLALIWAYIWEALISRIGDPDQSLLFWYLPILFLGVLSASGGLALIFFGIKRMKTG